MLNPLILRLSAAAPVATTESAPPPISCRAHALDRAQRQRQQALLDRGEPRDGPSRIRCGQVPAPGSDSKGPVANIPPERPRR